MDYVWSGHGPWSDQINPPTPLAAGGASEEKLPAASARSTSNMKRVRSESEVNSTGQTKATCKTQQAIRKLAVQEGKQVEGSKLVSRQFRKQRLALWPAGRGPDPSFTAMVF